MIFHSILFRSAEDRAPDVSPGAPDYFADLNLDQIVDAITAGREGYDLKPFFHAPLRDIDAIAYRHEVMQALEDSRLLGIIKTFANSMQTMRRHLVQSDKLRYREQKERWFLDAVEIYCDAVNRLARDLSGEIFSSRGLAAFRDYAAGYAVSEHFTSLTGQTKDLLADVASIEYCVLVDSPHLRVHKYAGEPDYTADVEATFERFKQREVEGHTFKFSESPDMNHIEAKVLELVGLLYPGTFIALTNFYAANKEYHDPGIMAFDREIQFYVAYLEHIAACKHAGLLFCYPRVTGTSKEIYSCQGFDLALARKLLGENSRPCLQRFSHQGSGTNHRRFRAEPGRQDDIRPHIRAVALSGQPRLPGPGQGGATVPVRRAVHALRKRGKHRHPARQTAGRPDPSSPDPGACHAE